MLILFHLEETKVVLGIVSIQWFSMTSPNNFILFQSKKHFEIIKKDSIRWRRYLIPFSLEPCRLMSSIYIISIRKCFSLTSSLIWKSFLKISAICRRDGNGFRLDRTIGCLKCFLEKFHLLHELFFDNSVLVACFK